MSNQEIPVVTMEQPPTPPARPAGSSVLVKGCAIGCGALLIFVILVGVGAFYIYNTYSGKIAQAMSRQLADDYATLKDTGKVPPEREALYQELVEIAQRQDASFAGVLLSMTVVESHLEDGTVDAAELKEAEETRDFLDKNPQVGMMSADKFMKEHEGLKEKAEAVQRKIDPSKVFAPQ